MPLPYPTLMLVTDRERSGGTEGLIRAVVAALAGGVNAVQLREKDLPAAELLSLARDLRHVTAGRALLIVNGSLEVALVCDAEGVHLPEDAPMVERPERPGFLIGRSVHSAEAAKRAWAECTDYLVAGPVYETLSHPDRPGEGARLIEVMRKSVGIPALAIGGITADRVMEVMAAGAAGVAVISAVLGASSPEKAACELREALEEAWCGSEEMPT